MGAYWYDERGRYGTGEDYDWFWKYADDEEVEIRASQDELWVYAVLENGIELLRYDGDEVHITVPDKVDGLPVVALCSTFDGFYELKSVVVPEGVTDIEGAFYGCEGLEKVTLPKTLVNLDHAFECCYSLKELEVWEGVESFEYAFQGTKIEHFTFPKGTLNIAYAFEGAYCLKSVYIPCSVESTYEAFNECESLETVVIEEGVQKLEDWTFFNCPSLKELTIPQSVTEFGELSVGYMEIREFMDERKLAYRIKGKQIVPGFKIKGVSGSAAEKYAREHEIEFVAI